MKPTIWEILARKGSGEMLLPEEIEQLNQWLGQEENRELYEQVLQDTDQLNLYFRLKQFDADGAWDRVSTSIQKKRTVNLKKLWPYWAVAATIVVFVAFQTLLPQLKHASVPMVEVSTGANDHSRPVQILPDGTRVTLNHSSKLCYPESFNDTVRLVELTGEAFFEVKPDKTCPFNIRAKGLAIKVVGTSFCVSSFDGAETTEVLVQTGSVELAGIDVLDQLGNKTVVLFPGEKGIFVKETRDLSKSDHFNPNQMAWFTRTLKFESETLDEVLNSMSQTYDLDFEVLPEIDRSQTLSATFEHQEPEYILKVVAMTLGLEVEKFGEGKYRLRKQKAIQK